jgi:ribosomal protein L24E
MVKSEIYGHALSSPASTVVGLGATANGTYDIELNNGNLKNKGKLKVTDDGIYLIFAQKKGIEFVRTVTRRVPAKTYWGTIGYHNQASMELVENFLRKFEQIGGRFEKQTPGHYTYYEINNSGELVIDETSSGYYFVKPFIFQFDGNEADLKNLINTEGKTYQDQLVINLETYQGEFINSWSN